MRQAIISNRSSEPDAWQRKLRLMLAAAGIAVCVCGIISAWRSGVAQLLTMDGRGALLLAQSDRALELAPDDPETHSGRAFILLNLSGAAVALPEYERAVALRPRDYFLWLELGRARDLADDEAGAIEALKQSVALAPEYALPRWQLGNVLFRAGRVEEGLSEMRSAALSDPTLLPNLIDLAWGASKGDAAVVEQALRPEKASWQLAFAKFFIKHGEVPRALALFRAAGGLDQKEREALLKELLASRRYHEAYEIWRDQREPNSRREEEAGAVINDGGFEGKLLRNEPGFGWQPAAATKAIRLSLDEREPHSGRQSLLIEFNGDSPPSQDILTQLIPVEPETTYHLRFAARMEELVSGGLPLILLNDVTGREIHTLGQSSPLQQETREWREYGFDFKTAETTTAVQLSLKRQTCPNNSCPIFGRLWLDDFALEKK